MRKFAIILSVAFAVALVYSCKKKKDTTVPPPEPVVNCDLPSEKVTTDGRWTYEYDADNRLVKEFFDSILAATFEYKDGGTTIVETTPGAVFTYTLNSDGKSVKSVEATNTGNIYIRHYAYTNGLLSRIISENSFGGSVPVPDTTLITSGFSNGNVISSVYKNTLGDIQGTINTTHNLTRPNNLPNARPFIVDAVTGSPFDKNLPITRSIVTSNSNATINFSYEFDSKGRIEQLFTKVMNGNVTTNDTASFKYRCE